MFSPLAEKGARLAELVVLNGVAAGTVFVLGDVPAVVGRSPEAHLRIGDPWISSMHAMFERRDDGLWVVDLESRNGIFIADERASEARVPDGTVVRLGRTEVRYAAGHASKADVPPAPEGGARPARSRETSRPDLTPAPRAPSTAARADAFGRRRATVLRMSVDDAGLEPGPQSARLVRAALDAAIDAAIERGAAAVRLAGVGVLAVFGLEDSVLATPDPTERALEAARAARQAVRDAGALELRAGLETGPVLAGRPPGNARGDLAVLGPAAERAERLVAVARPGEIVAGPGASSAPGLRGQGLVRLGDVELEVFLDVS
jgi:class 3 adenylate cyclase